MIDFENFMSGSIDMYLEGHKAGYRKALKHCVLVVTLLVLIIAVV